MKRSRFTGEQIIGILKAHQAGLLAPDLCRKHGHLRRDILPMAQEIWRHGRFRQQAAEGTQGGGREAEEASGGVHDGCVDASGDARKKLLTPGSRRNVVN